MSAYTPYPVFHFDMSLTKHRAPQVLTDYDRRFWIYTLRIPSKEVQLGLMSSQIKKTISSAPSPTSR